MSILEQVPHHVAMLRGAARAMELDGIGIDPNAGQVRALRAMADSMESEAASGRVPTSIKATGNGSQIGLEALAAAGTTANGMDQHTLASIQARRMTDPQLDQWMRDMKLQAGAGSHQGAYTVSEIEERLTSVQARNPVMYRNIDRLHVKLRLAQVGVMANVR